jgi:tetratricopeptide (TPR) repeat protein
MLKKPPIFVTLLLAASISLGGCSLRKMAVGAIADSLAGGGGTFASDEDPELVGQALPFALKTVESLLEADPQNEKLLLFACQGFTQYAFGYVELPAAELETSDFRAAQAQRQRALKLYLRARGYCLRAFDLRFAGGSSLLLAEPAKVLAKATGADVPLLFWTAGSWGSAIAAGSDRPDLVVDWPAARALLEKALAIDPDWDRGSLHDAMVVVEGLPEVMGGSLERAKIHHQRALELNRGERAATYVTWASMVSLRRQDAKEFRQLLEQALAIDPDRVPAERLANLLQQQRARRLLAQIDELFLDLSEPEETAAPAASNQ